MKKIVIEPVLKNQSNDAYLRPLSFNPNYQHSSSIANAAQESKISKFAL